MFGFLDNPDRETFREINRQATQSARFFMYLKIKKTIPPRDGEAPVQLEDGINRSKLIQAIENIVVENLLWDKDATERADFVISKANTYWGDDKNLLKDNAVALIAVLMSTNYICNTYYSLYPKSKKLLYIVNHLAKICSPGLMVIFDEDLPSWFRKTWPNISSLFEHYRANG